MGEVGTGEEGKVSYGISAAIISWLTGRLPLLFSHSSLTVAHLLLATSLPSPIGPVAERARVSTGSPSPSGNDLSLCSLCVLAMRATEHHTYLQIYTRQSDTDVAKVRQYSCLA